MLSRLQINMLGTESSKQEELEDEIALIDDNTSPIGLNVNIDPDDTTRCLKCGEKLTDLPNSVQQCSKCGSQVSSEDIA